MNIQTVEYQRWWLTTKIYSFSFQIFSCLLYNDKYFLSKRLWCFTILIAWHYSVGISSTCDMYNGAASVSGVDGNSGLVNTTQREYAREWQTETDAEVNLINLAPDGHYMLHIVLWTRVTAIIHTNILIITYYLFIYLNIVANAQSTKGNYVKSKYCKKW